MSTTVNVSLRGVATAAIGAALSVSLVLPAAAAEYGRGVTYDRIINADNDPANWISIHQNYSAHRYSGLDQINRDNIGNLKLLFTLAIGGMEDVNLQRHGPEQQGNPLVDGGFMYINDGWGDLYKVDVRSGTKGEFVFSHPFEIEHEGFSAKNRGGALWNDYYISTTGDGRVVAVDVNSGEVVWDNQLAQEVQGRFERFTAGPLALEDRILIQNTRTRGWLAAVDGMTGEQLWRWYSIPGPNDPGGETWADDQGLWKTGAGGLWTTGSYDPESRWAFWGTGQPSPTYDPEMRPGDNLYTEAAVAINTDNGNLEWYFQYIPNSSWDYDENGVHMLYELDGRKVVAHFARNGFYYTFDRQTGDFINIPGQYVNELNWTTGLDPKTGKPVEYDPSLLVQTYVPATRTLRGEGFERACPTWHGGISDQPPAFHPVKMIAYAAGTEGCFTQSGYVEPDPNNAQRVADGLAPRWVGREYTSDLYYGGISAVDVRTGQLVAKVNTDVEVRSGVTISAGGILWVPLQDGAFVAYNDDNLQELWRFETGTPLKASAMTYEWAGKQYVAILTSGRHMHPVNWDGLEHSDRKSVV